MSARSDLPADLEDRLVGIFELDPADRPAAIAALCAAAPDHAERIRAWTAAAALRTAASGRTTADAFAHAAEGARYGPFRVLERLATGGMGVVYLAEQTEPVRRRVALKVIDPRAQTPEFAARFDVERAALALLQHPHIARVVDAGTAAGTPWLAIEFIASRATITAFCDERRLGLRERLRLFVLVGDAVQHAHSRGILHRDLKPANVLVDTSAREPSPKVIDFGVAKLLGGTAADPAFATRAGALLGTSVYMSPEQIRGDADIDTRTDVYALGGLLHELLTGEYPGEEHDLAGLFERDLPRFLQLATTVTPSPPSERVTALGARSARRLGTTPAQLARALRSDLDAIVLRAMQKPRERRYQSASELVRDIERWLRGEPVEARGPGLRYRLRKHAARHAMALSVAAAVAVLAVLGVAWVMVVNNELARTNDDFRRVNLELEQRNTELALEAQRTAAALEQARAAEQRAVALQQDAERSREASQQATAAAEAARGQADAARASAEQAAATTAAAQAATARQAQRLRDEADAADQARMALADLLADESLGGGNRTVAALTQRLAELLDADPPLWPRPVRIELRQTLAWLLWGTGSYDAARAQFEQLATQPGDDRAARLDRVAALHALGDAVPHEDTARNVAHLRAAVLLLRAEPIDERDPRLLRIEGDLGFQMLQLPSAKDRSEGQQLILGSLFRALGFDNQAMGSMALFALISNLRQDLASAGFDRAIERLDRFLAPVLAESLLRSRLSNILIAATAFLPADAELLLRCAVHYGERFNGRGHPHTTTARRLLLAAIADRDGAGALADQRELYFGLAAEQADIDRDLGRRPGLPPSADVFVAAIRQALGEAATTEFARLADQRRPRCHPANPVVLRLAELGGR